MNYYDCPKCNVRTASSRGCGICGRRARKTELAAQRKVEADFERARRAIPYQGETLLGALTHAAAMNPTKKNLRALAKYEAELRELARQERDREVRARMLEAKCKAIAAGPALPPDEHCDCCEDE